MGPLRWHARPGPCPSVAAPLSSPLSSPCAAWDREPPDPPVCTPQTLLSGPAAASMAPPSRPTLPQGSGAGFPCPLPPTQCCMSPVCQSTPGSGGNTRPQGRAMEPRGEGARLPSCPCSPAWRTAFPPPLECCPLGDLRGEGLVPMLALRAERREQSRSGGCLPLILLSVKFQ